MVALNLGERSKRFAKTSSTKQLRQTDSANINQHGRIQERDRLSSWRQRVIHFRPKETSGSSFLDGQEKRTSSAQKRSKGVGFVLPVVRRRVGRL